MGDATRIRRPPRSIDPATGKLVDPHGVPPSIRPAVAAPDLSKCVAIVPFMDAILHPVEDGLRALDRAGVKVMRRAGCSAIDYARSALASLALIEGFDSILFVDSDVLFNPADAVRLLLRPESIVAGVYSQKRHGKLNFTLYPDTKEIPYGDRGIDLEVKGVGAGFLRVRREAFQRIADFHQLPTCTGNGCTLWPFFLPMIAPDEDSGEVTYLCEDVSFCRMAREAGLKVIADTRINLQHLGLYPYSWMEAATQKVNRPTGGVIPAVFPVQPSN